MFEVVEKQFSSYEIKNVSVFETFVSAPHPSFQIESSCDIGRCYNSLISHWLI
jgi:hypothetical protein